MLIVGFDPDHLNHPLPERAMSVRSLAQMMYDLEMEGAATKLRRPL